MGSLNLINFPKLLPLPKLFNTTTTPGSSYRKFHCIPVQQQVDDVGVMCECCSGEGWLVCDYCKGQKINVKGDNKRIYRRCPSCKAVGVVICTECKVYRCVTFPDQNVGEELKF